MPTLHSRRRWLTLLTVFLLPISPVVTWLQEHNYSGGWMSVFQCSVISSPAEGQTDIFLHNPPLFSTPLHLQSTLIESWKWSHQIGSSCMNSYFLRLCSPSIHNPYDKPNQDRYFTPQPCILVAVNIAEDCTTRTGRSRLSQHLCVITHALPYS